MRTYRRHRYLALLVVATIAGFIIYLALLLPFITLRQVGESTAPDHTYRIIVRARDSGPIAVPHPADLFWTSENNVYVFCWKRSSPLPLMIYETKLYEDLGSPPHKVAITWRMHMADVIIYGETGQAAISFNADTGSVKEKH